MYQGDSMIEVRELSREERIALITERDGPDCFLCGDPFKSKMDITFDHWIPQSKGGTWEIENLRLAHKRCNAIKGDVMPNPDGTLPQRMSVSTFRTKQQKRSERPDLCQKCTNGRSLGPQESCNVCGSGPMPERWPRWAKCNPKDCDHAEFWCWMCGSGHIDRKPVINSILGMQASTPRGEVT